MKKIVLAIAITIGIAFGSSAQSDRFFDGYFMYDQVERSSSLDPPTFPPAFSEVNESPVGSGLLLLTVLGAGYAVSKGRKLKEKR